MKKYGYCKLVRQKLTPKFTTRIFKKISGGINIKIRIAKKDEIVMQTDDQKTINLKTADADTDVIIALGNKVQYYKPCKTDAASGVISAICPPDLGGINSSGLRVFEEIFSWYQEIGDFAVTAELFSNLQEQSIREYILQAVKRVEKHKKLSREDVRILTHLMVYDGKKKDILASGVATCKDIERMYCAFADEYQWCYGFKKPCIDHRMSCFCSGGYEFCYTPQEVAHSHNLPIEVVHETISSGFEFAENQKILSRGQGRFYMDAFLNGLCCSESDKENLVNIVNEIKKKAHHTEKEIYMQYAKKLADQRKIHISEVQNFCCINALDYWEMSIALRTLGVVPIRDIRRRCSR